MRIPKLPWADTSLDVQSDDRDDMWALRQVAGNVTLSANCATAWYVLPAEQWAFLSDPKRIGSVMHYAAGLLPLLGRRVHLRGTTRPFDTFGWAKTLTESSPHRGPGWDEWLIGEQETINARASHEKQVFFGVDLPMWTWQRRASEWALKRPMVRELDRLLKDEATVGDRLVEHLDAVRADESNLRHLIARSAGVGLPAWVSDASMDIADSCSAAQWTAEPYQRCIKVTATNPTTDRVSVRYVTTLILGKPPELEVPDPDAPWLTLVDRLPFPTELGATVHLLSGTEAAGEAAKKLSVIRDMQDAYEEQGQGRDTPPVFERQAKHARKSEDQMRNARDVLAARVHGWYRITVWGNTGEEALKRAEATKKLFVDHQWEVHHPLIGQYRLTRELMPCEPLSTDSHLRRMELVAFASGMPHVAAKVGDGRGPVLGATVGAGRQTVTFDTHYSTEVSERSGVVLLAGEPGAGKSALLALIAAAAVRRGIRTTMLDPSGPLAGLCDLFPGQSQHLSLSNAPAGTLSPWRLIHQPRRWHFEKDGVPASEVDRLWQESLAEAYSERIEAAEDAALGTLPWALAEHKETASVLREVIRAVGGAPGGSFPDVIERLQGHSDHGKKIAAELAAAGESPRGALYLGRIDREAITSAEQDFASTLTVVSFPGLETPNPRLDRRYWKVATRRAAVLLQLALQYTSRAIYTGSMSDRKLVPMDEMRLFNGDATSQAFGARIAYDSRKWNACVPMSTQIPKHHLGMGLEALASTVMVGHLEHEDAAGDACDLLHVPRGCGYEQVFGTLNPNANRRNGARQQPYRDWVVRDVFGQIERVRITLPSELHAAIDTTARSNGHRPLTGAQA